MKFILLITLIQNDYYLNAKWLNYSNTTTTTNNTHFD